MAAASRAPKQVCLAKNETVSSFENWQQNLKYTLSLDPNFAQFLVEGVQWLKKTRAAPLCGFQDDGEPIPAAQCRTAQQKVTQLQLMLDQVANYCLVISRSSVVKNSPSIDSIWQAIRTHYGFQSTSAHFIDFIDIMFQPDECPEDLYQRLMAFVEGNLLLGGGGGGSITYHSENLQEDEELSLSLENLVVLLWLHLIHKDLPHLVKQCYGTELRSRTLASIKPEIYHVLDSLMDEVLAF